MIRAGNAVLEEYRRQVTPEERDMARRMASMPLPDLTELLCLIALNHSDIFTALLGATDADEPGLPLDGPAKPGDLVRFLPDPGAPEEVIQVAWEADAVEPYWRVVTRWSLDGMLRIRSGDAIEFVRVARQ